MDRTQSEWSKWHEPMGERGGGRGEGETRDTSLMRVKTLKEGRERSQSYCE